MQRGKLSLLALAACFALLVWTPALVADEPTVEFAQPGPEYFGPPPRLVPGPGWFAEDPGVPYSPAPPVPDSWDVAYPYKYFPQGRDGSEYYDPSFFPPDAPQECFLTPPPCYLGTFYLDVVGLARHSNIQSNTIIISNAGAPLVNTRDLSLDMEAGIRLGILLPNPNGNDWVGEYFGINAYQDSITPSATNVSGVFFGGLGAQTTNLTAEYQSKLDSLEFYVRSRQTRRLAPLAGFRYVRVGEEFNLMSSLTSPRAGLFSTTENDLFGFQLGCQGLICERGPWRLETMLKAGPYLNDIDIDAEGRNQNANVLITRHVDFWHTSFIGEWRATLVCRLGPRANFRMGYQGLWIEGLAIALNQVDNVSFSTGLRSADVSGAIYQGGYIGFDFSW